MLRIGSSRAGRLAGAPTNCTSTGTISFLAWQGKQTNPRARSSSTSTTTASSWRSAMRTGNKCSASRRRRARSTSGENPLPAAACPSSTTCAWTPMSGRISHPIPTGTGRSNTPSWRCTDASICGAVHRDVQGLPAPPKAIKLQRRPDHGSDVQATVRLRTARGMPAGKAPAGATEFTRLPFGIPPAAR
jgi:hypothetical protein